jgi:hypothetical protein
MKEKKQIMQCQTEEEKGTAQSERKGQLRMACLILFPLSVTVQGFQLANTNPASHAELPNRPLAWTGQQRSAVPP